MIAVHHSTEQILTVGNSLSLQLISPRHTPTASLQELSEALEEAGIDSPLSLQDSGLLPQERRKRYEYIEHVKQGLHMPVVLATYSPGSNLGNLHWIWCTSATDISSAMQSCHPIIESIKVNIPSFHTRAMRQAAFEKYGLISPLVKKAVLRHLYKDLLGDSSSAATTRQEAVDERVTAFFELEEPDLVFDLRETYSGNSSKFDLFWSKAKEFLEEGCRHCGRRPTTLSSRTPGQGNLCT